jgi:8-oxo-dGTP pyrophosphatase MutT (NUDIX family)
VWGPTPSREDRALESASARPIWARGRAVRLLVGLFQYARIAWWGLVSPRVTESRPLVIVQAVITSDEHPARVLLAVRSDLLGWELPGGTAETDETAEEAVVREVLEETGLQVDPVTHVGDWIRTGFRPHTARVYRCRVVAGVETPSHETPRLGWFDLTALPDAVFPWVLDPLRRACAEAEPETERDAAAKAEPETERDLAAKGEPRRQRDAAAEGEPGRERDAPVRVEERQGLRRIARAMRIDLAMRWEGLPAPDSIVSKLEDTPERAEDAP